MNNDKDLQQLQNARIARNGGIIPDAVQFFPGPSKLKYNKQLKNALYAKGKCRYNERVKKVQKKSEKEREFEQFLEKLKSLEFIVYRRPEEYKQFPGRGQKINLRTPGM